MAEEKKGLIDKVKESALGKGWSVSDMGGPFRAMRFADYLASQGRTAINPWLPESVEPSRGPLWELKEEIFTTVAPPRTLTPAPRRLRLMQGPIDLFIDLRLSEEDRAAATRLVDTLRSHPVFAADLGEMVRGTSVQRVAADGIFLAARLLVLDCWANELSRRIGIAVASVRETYGESFEEFLCRPLVLAPENDASVAPPVLSSGRRLSPIVRKPRISLVEIDDASLNRPYDLRWVEDNYSVSSAAQLTIDNEFGWALCSFLTWCATTYQMRPSTDLRDATTVLLPILYAQYIRHVLCVGALTRSVFANNRERPPAGLISASGLEVGLSLRLAKRKIR